MPDTVLFLAHVEGSTLGKHALEALGAALDLRSQLGAALVVGLAGEDVGRVAGSIAGCGATTTLAVEGAAFAESRYATDAAAAEALVRAAGATIVIAPGTSRWMRALPGVAHRLGGRVDTHVTSLDATGGTIAATRWYYRQRLEAVQTRGERPWVILLDPGCHAQAATAVGTPAVEVVQVEVPSDRLRTRVAGLEAPAGGTETIRPDAALLFVAGAGWTKKQADGQTHVPEAEQLILDFLARTKASLGGSKSLVDLSGEGQAVLRFMTHVNQVGQTGSTPRHPKGLSTCCHGEEPHVVGWRFVNERRVINLDPNCGWARGKADVVYVADAFAVMKKVNELLQSPQSFPASLSKYP